MMRGDGEETWNHGPGSSSRSPSARKSGRPIPAGTPHPAQPATNQPPEIRYAAVKGLTALPMFRTRTKSDRLLAVAPLRPVGPGAANAPFYARPRGVTAHQAKRYQQFCHAPGNWKALPESLFRGIAGCRIKRIGQSLSEEYACP